MRPRPLTLALALMALASPAPAGSTGHRGSVLATSQGVRLLRAAGLEPRVQIADLEARDRADRRADRAYAAQGASPPPT